MANYSGMRSANATLTAASVDMVYLTAPHKVITVLNVSGSATISFTVSEPGGPCPVPTVNGQNCYILPASLSSLDVRHDGQFGAIVQLISSGSPAYAVEITS